MTERTGIGNNSIKVSHVDQLDQSYREMTLITTHRKERQSQLKSGSSLERSSEPHGYQRMFE